MLRTGQIVGSTLSLVGSGWGIIVAATNGSQRVGGCNPVLRVVLNLWNAEVLWRYDSATYRPVVAGVTFSDSDSAPVPKFLNPGPDSGPAILQIWESDSCSDSGYNHPANFNLAMFLPKKSPHKFLLLPKWKSDSGSESGFSQILTPDPDPKEKRRILPESTPVIRIRSHLWHRLNDEFVATIEEWT